jgi:putative nucleotidyltransferase with HDIG domain
MRVIELASDPDVHVAQLARLIMKDTVLASRVLTLANSSDSAPSQPVTTLTQAMVRLGTARVKNLALTVSFYSRMCDARIYGARGRAVMDHGLGTAYLARLIAERARIDVDEAFLCGLLHDIGKLIIYKVVHDSHAEISPEDLDTLVADRHCEVGARALRAWRLPESIEHPVLFHHDYQSARSARRPAAVLYLANILSHRYGFGCEPREYDALGDPVAGELGIDAAWLSETDDHAPGLFQIASQALV